MLRAPVAKLAWPAPRVYARACSSASTILWHNPKCSKSCAALALLEERNVPFTVREYLTDTPSFTELSELHKK